MKAENVRQFMLKKYPTKDYLDCPVPKHHWEVIQEYAEHYARIQIEKDRERVKNEVLADEWTCEAINNLPITLD